jgi:hypothetical protein
VAVVVFAILVPAVLSAGPAFAYTPDPTTANGKTPAEMAQDCDNPQLATVIGTPAQLELPECTVLGSVPGTTYTTVVTAPENPNSTDPTWACSPAGASTGNDHSVTVSSGWDVSGFAIFGGVFTRLLATELAPEFGWSQSTDVTDGTSETANVPWDSVGWLDASLQVGIGQFRVEAKYADATSADFTVQAEVPNGSAPAQWTAQSRVMSEDEYHNHCNNTPTNVSYLNTLSPTSAGWYPSNGRLVNTVLNNMCLDDTGWSTTPGTQLEVWLCGGGADGTQQQANQTWTVTLQGSGFVIKNNYSGLCLDDYHSGTGAGNVIDQWTCNGSSAQKWYYNDYQGTVTPDTAPQDVYELVSAAAPNLCAVPSGTTNGSPMVLGDCGSQLGVPPPIFSDSNSSYFASDLYLPVDSSLVSPAITVGTGSGTPPGTGALVNFGTGSCLDDTNWSTVAWTQMQIWNCTGGSNQTWTLERDGTIKNSFSGLCLDVYANSATVSQSNPVAAIQYGCNSSDPAQVFTARWTTFSGQPDGYEIVNDHGMCLDVHGDWSTNGNTVDWYTCNHTGAQDWYVT